MRSHYGIPMPPRLAEPAIGEGRVRFRWNGAFDVTGHDLRYELEVASSPDFAADAVLLRIEGIVDERSWVEYDVDVERTGSGRRYVRLFARSVADPARFWQIASNRSEIDGQKRFGVREFVVP